MNSVSLQIHYRQIFDSNDSGQALYKRENSPPLAKGFTLKVLPEGD